MFSSLNHIIVMTSDMNRSVEFYESIMGFELENKSGNWTEFKLGDMKFALHGGGKPNQNPNTSEPHSASAGTASISFNVDDVAEVYSKLNSKGVTFTLEPTLRENEGIKLAVAQDPDGFEICFAQRL